MSWVTHRSRRHPVLLKAALFICDCVCHSPLFVQVASAHSGSGVRSVHIHRLLTSMKKIEPGPQLRHLKYRDKIGGKFPVPSTIEVQVVGGGGQGLPSAVILATDHSKYMFNCGEGTQRIATEFKMRLSKLENMFFTHMNWDSVGGLLGMGLTLEGMKVPQITIHGPPGVENVAMMAKGFAESTHMKVEKRALADSCFEDSAFRIDYVPFFKAGFDPDKLRHLLEERVAQEPESKRHKRAPMENAVAVAYICWPHPPQRKIILEKCVDLGIEKGPVLGRLKNGESITLDDGTVIHPDQVLSEPEVSRPILVVDCPSEEYLDSFLTNQQLTAHQGCDATKETQPVLVVHMTPLEVYETPQYQQWLCGFPEATEHLVLHRLTSDVGFEGVYRYQSRLHLVHPTIFPHLRHHPLEKWAEKNGTEIVSEMKGDGERKRKIVMGCTNLRYMYRPRKGFISDQCIELDHTNYVKEALQQDEVEEALKMLHSETAANTATPGGTSNITSPNETSEAGNTVKAGYPRLTFLGTGSSIPSKGRNVSGLLVHLRDDATLVLDCGEGTSGQLYRHFGQEGTEKVLRDLKAVFVSHLHADHHMGLFSLLRDRKTALEAAGREVTPVLLLAPIQMGRWLQFYDNQVEPVQMLLRHVPLQKLLPHMLEVEENKTLYDEVLDKVSLTQFVPVEVEHCPNAFGVAVKHTDGWKLVFSGDTMPCQRLVVAGEDCDVLVHEATHEDDLEEEAKMKRHSTTSQAIDIGQRMGAKFILLNHFSQRYAKIPIFSKDVPANVGIAFDNMSVSMQELPLLPRFIPAVKALFAEEHADLEAKTWKRNKRRELKEKVQVKAKS